MSTNSTAPSELCAARLAQDLEVCAEWSAYGNLMVEAAKFIRQQAAESARQHELLEHQAEDLRALQAALGLPDNYRELSALQAEVSRRGRTIAELERAIHSFTGREVLRALLNAEDLARLERFYETSKADEHWDLSEEEMRRLSDIGVVEHEGGGWYGMTFFGLIIVGEHA